MWIYGGFYTFVKEWSYTLIWHNDESNRTINSWSFYTFVKYLAYHTLPYDSNLYNSYILFTQSWTLEFSIRKTTKVLHKRKIRRSKFQNPITPIDIPNSYSYLYLVIIQNILILVKFLKSYPTISADKKNEKKFKFLYKIFSLSSFLITYSIVLNIKFLCTIPSILLLYIKFRRESTVAYLFFNKFTDLDFY